MQPEQLIDYYRRMNDNRILVSFKGPLSQAILIELGGYVRKQFKTDQQVKRIFSIFVEMTQNVLHHSAEKDPSTNSTGVGVIMLVEKPESYLISSGNLVKLETGERLIETCNYLNSLSEEELKGAYKTKLKMATTGNDKGAGLGLYEISRKSNGALEPLLMPFDSEHQFFVLTAKVNKGGDNE